MRIGRRAFASGVLSVLSVPFIAGRRPARAHSEHGTAADLVITVGEFYFRGPDGVDNGQLKLESGRPHLIRFVNEGALDHEVHFGREPNPETGLYGQNLFAPQAPDQNDGEHRSHGFLGLHLPPWDDPSMPAPFGELHVWIPRGLEGEWEVGCFVPGHYEAGQHAPLIIVPPGRAT